MSNKTRMSFELTEEALEQFEELQKKAGATTRAELVRNALKLYNWALDKKSEGKALVAVEKAPNDDEFII